MSKLSNFLLVIVLGILTWNIKQGFEMIEASLKDINDTLKKNKENDNI